MADDHDSDFARGAEGAQGGFLAELVILLRENQKWWLTPILIVLALISGLFLLSVVAPAAAPFIYTLF